MLTTNTPGDAEVRLGPAGSQSSARGRAGRDSGLFWLGEMEEVVRRGREVPEQNP